MSKIVINGNDVDIEVKRRHIAVDHLIKHSGYEVR